MKAIETLYAGYRFRSRLEARWAVFFDSAGIEYQYEPEGFELESGVRYLPDFYLPRMGAWAEVKARYTPDLIEKSWSAAREITRDTALEAGLGEAFVFLGDLFRQPRRGATYPVARRAEMSYHGEGDYFGIWVPTSASEYDLLDRPHPEDLRTVLESGWSVELDHPWVAQYRGACRSAQQARFEFGETPGRGL
jgi:hypothetical protein